MEKFSKEEVDRDLKQKAEGLVHELKETIDWWKPRREKTIKATKDLAEDCDETHKKANAVKIAAASTSIAATIGLGIAGIVFTGGLATPLIIGAGVVVGVGGGATIFGADWVKSSCSKEARNKAQGIMDEEKNAYEDVRTQMQKLQHTLECTLADKGWPSENAVLYFLNITSIDAAGTAVTVSNDSARILVNALTTCKLIHDYKEVLEIAKEAGETAKKVADGARKVATAANEAGLPEVAKNALEAAEAVEQAAAKASKRFASVKNITKATEDVLSQVSKANKVVATCAEDMAKAAKGAKAAAETVAKAAAKGKSMLTAAKNWAGSFFRAATEGAEVVAEGAEAAAKSAEAAAKSAEAAAKGAKIAAEGAETAAKISAKTAGRLAKAVPFLNVVFLLMDAYDALDAGVELVRGSKAGNHLRSQAEKFESELKYVQELYERLKNKYQPPSKPEDPMN